MKIVPFGKQKGQDNGLSAYADLLEDTSAPEEEEINDGGFDTPMESQSPGRTKIDEVQAAIEGVVGEPSLDNLMIILAAIGMSQVGIKVADDGSNLSISGIIDFSEPESKISKKE